MKVNGVRLPRLLLGLLLAVPGTHPVPAARVSDKEHKPRIKLETASGSGVTSLAFTPDGKLLASGCEDGTVKVWDLTAEKVRTTFKVPTIKLNAVAVSRDGKNLAVGFLDERFRGGVKLYQVSTGREAAPVKGHGKEVLCLAFSPDGKTLASGGYDERVKLWDVATGKEIRTLSGHESKVGVSSVVFTPDGKGLVSSGYGTVDKDNKAISGEVKLWDVATGKEVRTLPAHSNFVISLAMSPDGKMVAAGDRDWVTLWDRDTGRELRRLKGPRQINSVAFSPDSHVLAAGGGIKRLTPRGPSLPAPGCGSGRWRRARSRPTSTPRKGKFGAWRLARTAARLPRDIHLAASSCSGAYQAQEVGQVSERLFGTTNGGVCHQGVAGDLTGGPVSGVRRDAGHVD